MAAKIALGVSSSVSIYKACEVLRGFQEKGYTVQVIMTRNATRLVSPLLFSSLSGLRTIVDLWDEPEARSITHVKLASEISLLCVAPATADIIGKFAGGIADDFLSTFFLSVRSPVVIAPAMNETMYVHPQTQANIKKLKGLGVILVEPGKGYLACGTEGTGRLAQPEIIVRDSLAAIAAGKELEGLKILVTAGPTREYLDPVRFISNPSSGKMGYELAREALSRGARVVMISGPSAFEPTPGVETIRVESAREMEKAVLKRFPASDVLIMAAAVSDFRFRIAHKNKIAKAEVPGKLEIEMIPDILALAGKMKRKGQLLVGFAAETGDVLVNARKKMAEKGADIMVGNRVGAGLGFGTDDNEVTIVTGRGRARRIPRTSKREISRIVLDCVGEALGKKERSKKPETGS